MVGGGKGEKKNYCQKWRFIPRGIWEHVEHVDIYILTETSRKAGTYSDTIPFSHAITELNSKKT